mmetsp:Transcript_13837/g.58600  ORF Transcript_13837/g.58600 Transcript_13837/m.58600 type:complete len:220 (+) Transcript_13837:871-1530(+)
MLYFCMALLLCFFHGASASRMFTDLDFFGGASLSSNTIVTCERGLCIFPTRPRPWMLNLGRNVPLPTTASATKSLSRSRSWLFVAFAAALRMTFLTTSAYFFGDSAHCTRASDTEHPRITRRTSLNFFGDPLACRRTARATRSPPASVRPVPKSARVIPRGAGARISGDGCATSGTTVVPASLAGSPGSSSPAPEPFLPASSPAARMLASLPRANPRVA